MLVRQSLKSVISGYVLCLVLAAAIGVYWLAAAEPPDVPWWAPELIPLVLVTFVVIRHVKRRLTKIIVADGRLRYERGLFSKIVETIELNNLQDLRMHQTLMQRMFNIGDISLETAGKSSWEPMLSIDRPQETVTHILDLARAAKQTPPVQG